MPTDSSLVAIVDRLERVVADIGRRGDETVRPALLSRRAAAQYLGISVSMLDQLRRRGDLPAIVIAHAPQYAVVDLDRLIVDRRERRGGSAPAP